MDALFKLDKEDQRRILEELTQSQPNLMERFDSCSNRLNVGGTRMSGQPNPDPVLERMERIETALRNLTAIVTLIAMDTNRLIDLITLHMHRGDDDLGGRDFIEELADLMRRHKQIIEQLERAT